MQLRVGKSIASVEREAAREAVGAALRQAAAAAVALVFTTDQYDPQVLASAITRELDGIPWAGCSSAGVIAGAELLPEGVVVGVLDSATTRVGIGSAGRVSGDPRGCGRRAVAAALEGMPPLIPPPRRAILVLSDGITGDTAEVLRGALEEGGAGVEWAGGGAGDNFRYTRSFEFAHDQPLRDHVVAVAIDNDEPLGVGVHHGWRPYSPVLMVTRSHGNTVLELDYEPAFQVYRRVAAARGDGVEREDFTAFASLHPLGIPQAPGTHLVRDPLTVSEAGGLVCVGAVPEGSLVRVMVGTPAELLAASRCAAEAAVAAIPRQPQGALLFDCVSRLQFFGTHFEEELSTVARALGEALPVAGCLTMGEIAAVQGGVPQFHNKTAVVVAV